ncbi:MAG: GtrA family protein [Micromonosporaceae bacterium]|nr:GtrA family protein [Micromonosporaceae bacterium]
MLIRRVRRVHLVRFARYAAGSLLASATSAVVFWVVFHLGGGPVLTSVTTFLAGAVVNFSANRFWTWQRRVRAGLSGDAFRFAVLAVVTATAATAVARATNLYAPRSAVLADHLAVVVEASYFATYATLFLVKFVLLDRVVFASRPGRRDRSRAQVEKTTRV